jgi:hypothetical protein
LTECDGSKRQLIDGTISRKLSQKKEKLEICLLARKAVHAFHRSWASNRGEACFLLEPVSERHQPCCPIVAFFGCQVVWPRCDDRQSVQEGPKQPGPHELWRWRCWTLFWSWPPGSRMGELSGWRLPAAVRRLLLTRAPLPGYAG